MAVAADADHEQVYAVRFQSRRDSVRHLRVRRRELRVKREAGDDRDEGKEREEDFFAGRAFLADRYWLPDGDRPNGRGIIHHSTQRAATIEAVNPFATCCDAASAGAPKTLPASARMRVKSPPRGANAGPAFSLNDCTSTLSTNGLRLTYRNDPPSPSAVQSWSSCNRVRFVAAIVDAGGTASARARMPLALRLSAVSTAANNCCCRTSRANWSPCR